MITNGLLSIYHLENAYFAAIRSSIRCKTHVNMFLRRKHLLVCIHRYTIRMYHLTIARLILKIHFRQGTAMCLARNDSSKRTDCLTKFLASEHICKMVCGTAKPLVPAGRGKERINSKTCRKYEILVLEVQQICRRSTYFQQLFSSLKNIC